MRRRVYLGAVTCAVASVLAWHFAFAQSKSEDARIRVTISKETTYVTGPLRADGYVDYLAAMNECASRGVTFENNAVVPLTEIFGPSVLPPSIRAGFFDMLGCDPLPEDGSYLVSSGDFAKQLDQEGAGPEARGLFDDGLQVALQRPWARSEFPLVARWLESNASFLPRLIEATRRTRYYTPFLLGDDQQAGGTLVSVLLPILQHNRDAARILQGHAMMCLSEGKTDEAWEDLLACHRLSRLCGQDPTLIGALVAIAIDGIAVSGDVQLIQHSQLTSDQYRKMLDQLRDIGPLPNMVDKIDKLERFMFLDVVCAMARGDSVDLFGGQEKSSRTEEFLKSTALSMVDWDSVLKTGNSWYDRIVEGMRLPTHEQRQRAGNLYEQDVQTLAANTKDPWRLAGALLQPRKVASETMANILIALLIPALNAAQKAEDRANATDAEIQIAFALAAYRADHQGYPSSLRQLTPNYMAEVPEDPFTGGDFVYQARNAGFQLYSLGPNMKDDQGRVYHLDRNYPELGPASTDWDDYRLEIPVPIPEKIH